MKAIIENNTIKDIAHTNPFEIFAPVIAELYDTEVPETAKVGDELIDDVWVTPVIEEVLPVITDVSEEEINQSNANICRDKRNQLLVSSDWTQVADSPIDQAAWATYRKALRDMPSQEGFPNEVTWPVAPE